MAVEIARESLQVFDRPFPDKIWPSILNIAVKHISSASALIATCKLFAEEVPKCPRFQENSLVEQRRAIIEGRLKRRGLKLRNDSRLCTDFINNGVGNADLIAQIMEEMSWYFNATTYRRSRFIEIQVETPEEATYTVVHPGSDHSNNDWYNWNAPPNPEQPLLEGPHIKRSVDTERGKKLAMDAWVDYHLMIMRRYVLAHELEGLNRPPASLWRALNDEIGTLTWPLLKKVVRDEKVRRILHAEAKENDSKSEDGDGVAYSDEEFEDSDVQSHIQVNESHSHDTTNDDNRSIGSSSTQPQSNEVIATDQWLMTDVNNDDPLQPEYECSNCGYKSSCHLRCGGCKVAYYCNSQCQKADWKSHKSLCKELHKQRHIVEIKTITGAGSSSNSTREPVDFASMWERVMKQDEAGSEAKREASTSSIVNGNSSGNNTDSLWNVQSDLPPSQPHREVSDEELSQIALTLDELHQLFESTVGTHGTLNSLVGSLKKRRAIKDEDLMSLCERKLCRCMVGRA